MQTWLHAFVASYDCEPLNSSLMCKFVSLRQQTSNRRHKNKNQFVSFRGLFLVLGKNQAEKTTKKTFGLKKIKLTGEMNVFKRFQIYCYFFPCWINYLSYFSLDLPCGFGRQLMLGFLSAAAHCCCEITVVLLLPILLCQCSTHLYSSLFIIIIIIYLLLILSSRFSTSGNSNSIISQ